MPSKSQILTLVHDGYSYDRIADELGIRAGLAYLIATGLPADGGDGLAAEDLSDREGLLEGSTQHLANPPAQLTEHPATVARWLTARAARDTQMQAAAAARSAEPPPIEGAQDDDDVIDVLGRQHNQVNFILEELKAIPGVRKGGSPDQQRQRRSLLDMITVRLAKHETAEEGHFWPAVREVLPDGDKLAQTAREQEHEGKQLLARCGGLTGTEDEFDELVEKIVAAVRKHVAFEDQVFARFKKSAPAQLRSDLGRQVRRAFEQDQVRAQRSAERTER